MRRSVLVGRCVNIRSAGWAWVSAAAAVLCGVGLAGCDSGSFAPPPPPELAALPSARSLPPTTAVELIEAPGANVERDVWLQAARTEAGLIKSIFAVQEPPPASGDAADWQAALVRSAPRRGIGAVLIEPVDSAAVVKALDEVRAQGTQVVLLGPAVASPDPARPFNRVTFSAADEPLTALVQAAKTAARASGMKENAHALIVISEIGPCARQVAARGESALKAAGFGRVEVLELPHESTDAEKVVTARIEADPEFTFVLAIGNISMSVVVAAHNTLKARRDFVIGGVLSYARIVDRFSMLIQTAGLIDTKLPEFGRAAIRTAAKLARGEPVEPVVTIPLAFEALGPQSDDAAARAPKRR